MAYRKMYKWALGLFVLQSLFSFVYFYLLSLLSLLLYGYFVPDPPVLINYLGLLGIVFPLIVFGVIGNYLYYKYAKNKIIERKAKLPFSDTEEIALALQKVGGVSPWAAVLATLISFAITVWLLVQLSLTLT